MLWHLTANRHGLPGAVPTDWQGRLFSPDAQLIKATKGPEFDGWHKWLQAAGGSKITCQKVDHR
jgi:hypothetical protein